jgi:uncharacterized protein
MKSIKYFSIIILFLITNIAGLTQTVTPDKVVDIKVIIPHPVSSTGLADAEVVLNIKKGWHINANKPLDQNLSPTVITFKESTAYQIIKITYPEPMLEKLPISESQLALYEDQIIIKVQIKVTKKTDNQLIKLEGNVKYQPCNNQTCLFPTAKPFNINLVSKKAK